MKDEKFRISDLLGSCLVSFVIISIPFGCFLQIFSSGTPFIICICLGMALIPVLTFLLYNYGRKNKEKHQTDKLLQSDQYPKLIKQDYIISDFFPISPLDWLVTSYRKEPDSYQICFEQWEVDNKSPGALCPKYDDTILVIIPQEFFSLSYEEFVNNLEKLTNEKAKNIKPNFGAPYEKYRDIDMHDLPELKEFFGFSKIPKS